MVEVRDREILSRFLLRDPASHAYQIGDLDEAFLPHTRWFADDAADPTALVLLYSGLSLPAVLTAGGADSLRSILRDVRGALPSRFQFVLPEDHLPPFKLFFSPVTQDRMLRMAVSRDRYRRRDNTGVDVVRLGHSDTADIVALYRHYPDNFFEPYQLESGLYFGVRRDGKLASIAGIHTLSEEFDVAAIGNLVTDPTYRGQGLATACTGRLLDALFERVSLVTLNTSERNRPAQRTFEKLGFSVHGHFVEGRVD